MIKPQEGFYQVAIRVAVRVAIQSYHKCQTKSCYKGTTRDLQGYIAGCKVWGCKVVGYSQGFMV